VNLTSYPPADALNNAAFIMTVAIDSMICKCCTALHISAHAGSVAVRLLADRTGLTGALSAVLQRRSFVPVHDRGRVLVDVAVMRAAGGEAISDIAVLRHQEQVLGPVASAPTVWRALDELTPARLRSIEVARARSRRHVWAQLPLLPASKVLDTDLGVTVVLDMDATLVGTSPTTQRGQIPGKAPSRGQTIHDSRTTRQTTPTLP